MAVLPTMQVYRKSDGKQIIINQSDYDASLHSKKPMVSDAKASTRSTAGSGYHRKRKVKAGQ
jgi:TPP-dependent trihydroxycyclohexane-1,2-dione (THcHDO) dehydratase